MNSSGVRGQFNRRPPALITWAGTTSGTRDVSQDTTTPLYFQAGVYTLTVNVRITATFIGIAPGGNGGNARGDLGVQEGGGGGGSGSYTTGTSVTLDPNKTYTLTIGAGGSLTALTFVNTTDVSTLVSCGAGSTGGQPTGGAAGVATVGSGLVNGKVGGVGGTEAAPGTSTPGTGDANGAGSGGGGQPADGSSAAQAGGLGKDEAGGAPTAGKGGNGGGYDFNGTKCGGGGGGAVDDNATNQPGRAAQPGGCKFTTFTAFPPVLFQG